MTEEFKKYESSVKTKHSFGWTPQFEETFHTQLNLKAFGAIVKKTVEKLDWDLVYQDAITIEAKRKGKWNNWTEKITVVYEYGKVTLKSVSLGSEIWDNGRNAKRVRLFMYAFHQIEQEYDQESLHQLAQEAEAAENWDDYVVPDTLPKPFANRKPRFWIPVVGGIMAALLLGFVFAFLSVNFIYVLGLYEVGVAFAIGFAFQYLIKAGNYTHYNSLRFLLVGTVVGVYLSNLYFQYLIILFGNHLDPIGLIRFIAIRLDAGLKIRSLDAGSAGLLILWIIQPVLTYFMALFQVVSKLTAYQLDRIPEEVVNFACYHFVKNKTASQVRSELHQMGWKREQEQNEVMEAVGAIGTANEMRRMS